MHSEKPFFLCLILFLGISGPLTAQFHDADWLEQGLLAEFRGNHEQALEIWIDAYEELEKPDARIGFEFIRITTEQKLDHYYEIATELYYWAISEPYAGVNRAALRQEMERLQPIVGSGVYRQWSDWYDERDRQLASDMRGFWTQLDPTPGNRLNERLIEHWLRIAYAREHFDRNRSTVYGTDDRALIYIRYGSPDRQTAGSLRIDHQNIGRWLAQQFETAEMPPDPDGNNPSFSFQGESSNQQNLFDQLEEYVFQFHQFPEYEIWAYHTISDRLEEPLIYIFGTDLQTGTFSRRKSLDDLIPQRAYLSDRRSLNLPVEFVRQGLTPALVLQMLYYEQLMEVDDYFSSRLNYIRESFIDQGPIAYQSLDLAVRSRNRELLEVRENEAPLEISTFSRLMPVIPVDVHQYRILDDSDRPVILTFLESRPGSALLNDLQFTFPERGVELSDLDELLDDAQESLDYRLNHKLLIYDSEWNSELYFDHSPTLRVSVDDPGSTVIQSVYRSEHRGQNFQSASAELTSTNPDITTRYTDLFPAELRGLGSLKNQQPPPLGTEPETLEMADLILGFRDDRLSEDYPFSFRVANDQMIPSDESLVLHFEVYNLAPAEETGFTRFDLTYRIYPVLEDGTVASEEEEFYLTIRFEDDQTRVVEELEIQTSNLSRGLYELQVFIEDMENNQERQRNIRFEVTE